MKPIPVIDLFAGPGGLGEGFSSLKTPTGNQIFQLRLSVEKDTTAHKTLSLRAIYRRLAESGGLSTYLDYVRGQITGSEFVNNALVKEASAEASREAKNLELGKCDVSALDADIRRVLEGEADWLLIGGPPCQAYSLVGRARRANDTKFEEDEKHFLYREYLRIIKVHRPAVFVMENVKGMLSSRHGGDRIFERILDDLSAPARGLQYQIRSVVKRDESHEYDPDDYIVEAERFGIPQCRHRVVLIGVRSDLAHRSLPLLEPVTHKISVDDVIADLPKIRSRLSRTSDSASAWHAALVAAPDLVRGWGVKGERKVMSEMKAATREAKGLTSAGGTFMASGRSAMLAPPSFKHWIVDPSLGGVLHHEARAHMAPDLGRYLFASAFAKTYGYTPKLHLWPRPLLPAHESASVGDGEFIPFPDRFRVQVAGAPATTIVSHICKDGHYYVHFDPSQCRSLTVREAARVQTFPDNYFFEGNRTQQYVQVGNAVPPLLAHHIARAVAALFVRAPSAPASGKAVGRVPVAV